MKRLTAALAFACLAAAGANAQTPACTQVVDQIPALSVATPGWMTGTIDLSLGYSLSNGTYLFPAQSVRITVANGVVSSCLPPGYYTASYLVRKPAPLTGTISSTRYWTVPSTGPRTVQYIESSTPVTPTLAIAWAQLPAPSASGTYCVQSVNGVISWGACTGAGSTLSWSALVSSGWTSLTSSQWSALTP